MDFMYYQLTVKVSLKNNKKFETWFECEGRNCVPVLNNLGKNAFKTIKNGAELIALINGEWGYGAEENWEENGQSQIERITDFSLAKEIVLKEKLEMDDYTMKEAVILNEETNEYFRGVATQSPQSTRINFPKSVQSVGKHAFDNCPNLELVLSDDSASLDALSKTNVPFYVIGKTNEKTGKEHKSLPMEGKKIIGKTPDEKERSNDGYPTPFTSLRVVTHSKIVVLYLDDGNWHPFIDPDDYMPYFDGETLQWGDVLISSVPELAAALYFVLDDSIDYTALKETLLLMADQISAIEYCEKAQSFYKSGFVNSFTKADFAGVLNISGQSEEPGYKDVIIKSAIEVMKKRQPAFEEVIKPFVSFIREVQDIHEIEFIDIVEGYVEENDIADDRLEETARLDLWSD